MEPAGQSLVQTCCGATLTTVRSVVIPSSKCVRFAPAHEEDPYSLRPSRVEGKNARHLAAHPPRRIGRSGGAFAFTGNAKRGLARVRHCPQICAVSDRA